MNNKSLKAVLIMCITFMLIIGASLLLSINLANQFSGDLVPLSESGEKINQSLKSYEYSSSVVPTDYTDHSTGDALSVFTYQNIDFVSYSTEWDETKLEELALELFNNVHGEEIAYVARVELHDDNYDEYAGLHRSSYEKHSLPISVNNLFPSSMTVDFSALSSVMVLTGANENTTVASMARTLSHEYGHHFTQYYFGFKGTNLDLTTKYASIRKESGTPIYAVVTDWQYYLDNHMWDIQEIAAEDYVFLMGSPLARQEIDYLDNSELADLFSRNQQQYNEYTSNVVAAMNAYPHENPVLNSPSQVEGLANYYYSFVDAEAPIYTDLGEFGTMDMKLTQTSNGSYTMTWSIPLTFSDITYTLVAYDANDYMLKPIKTVNGEETPSADFGIQKVVRNYNEYTINDGLDDVGFVRFRIIITFFDGSVAFSDAYDVQF